MPSIHLPYVNIALDIFALFVTVVILSVCASEYSRKSKATKYFLIFQISIVVALIADIISWIGEGHPSLAVMMLISNTVMASACRVAIAGFMQYLIACRYANSSVARYVGIIFNVICVFSIAFCIGNAFFGYVFYVNEAGHYEHTGSLEMAFIYLLYPIFAVFAIVLMSFFAKRSAKINRIAFLVYTAFPVAGVIADYVFHGISLTCVGFTCSILVIYTSIYRTRRKELETQKRALMLSQINPHFVYNTLSTIAAMCDVSPKQAKNLTIDFAQYLRNNIGTLTADENIPFEREMEHVECYLKIEKARFRERLNVIYSIQCKDFSIPPLTVQPLVENAIKHGVTKKAAGGTVRICTHETDNSYIIDIIDDGVGFDTENTELHVGIQNVKKRVASLCRGELTYKSTVGVGTKATVEIPKKKGIWR